MKRLRFLFSLMLIVAVALPTATTQANAGGVDDLRGRWDITWELDEFGSQSPLIFYINDLAPALYAHSTYIATGCLRSPETSAFMPLSLVAYYNPDDETYEMSLYSTIVPPDGWEPFIIRLNGTIETNDNGVTDDLAAGTLRTGFDTGFWDGVHHDRRRTKCPGIQNNDLFQGELYSHRDMGYDPAQETVIFDTETVIVASAMLVEDPFGNVTRVEYYTDLFSPDVDFIGRFRFTGSPGGPPIVGMPYTFTLLDALGNPIEGAVSTDTWNRCNQSAPINYVAAQILEDYLTLSWDPVTIIPGEFDPADYQITMHPMGEQFGEYGAGSINSAWHNLPLNAFIPPAEGSPDGWDYGQGLLEMEDGKYQINVWAWNHADETNGGLGSDCAVHDSSEAIMMTKQGDQFSFESLGAISGTVFEANGIDPIADVHVAACSWDDSFCMGAETNVSGNYTIFGLPAGDYRVVVWGEQGGWINEYYNETPFHHEATQINITAGETIDGINFTMEQGGSISGTVYESDAITTIEYIHVDACAWDDSFCMGAETDANGDYTINGLLPEKTYRVSVWGQPGWANQFYQESIWWDQATEVSIGTTGVDFILEPGGSIAGTVIDTNTKLGIANIGVDIEEGGYGTCTDEDGNYTLAGLPFGTYNIVGGRDFCEPHSYVEQSIVDVEINLMTPDISGYDFELVQGGSISGRVTEEGTTDAVPWIDVVVCDVNAPPYECAWGTTTDNDGNYTVAGLAEGTYYVFVYQQGNWIEEFYNNAPNWDEATPVPLNSGENLAGIDFELVQGGSISGTVQEYETETKIPGIHVDACHESVSEEMWGQSPLCKGAHTDENGVYTITNLQPGNYRLVIWGDEIYLPQFYNGVPTFYEATLVTVEPEITKEDVNFSLFDYGPAFNAWPVEEYVDGWGWEEGEPVTLTITGPGVTYEETQTPIYPDWNPNTTWVQFNFQGEFDLQPGFIVTLSNGTQTKQQVVTSLEIANTELADSSISGTAEPNSHVYVWYYHETGRVSRHEIADEFGNWSANFSIPGDELGEEEIYNIPAGAGGEANQVDQDGDGTQVNWWMPQYTIIAHPQGDGVSSHGWTIGDEITLYIDNNEDPLDGFYYLLATQTAWENPDDPGVGHADFWDLGGFDLTSGMYVIVTDGTVIDTLQVESLTIDAYDAIEDTVTGTAPAERDVGIVVHQTDGDYWLVTTSDGSGHWLADFGAEGIDILDVYDIHAMLWDNDGDATQANYIFPP